MKKIFSTLFCLACFGLMTACIPGDDPDNGGDDNGGGKDNGKTENVTPEQMKEKGFALKYNYFRESGKVDFVAVYTRKGSSTRLDVTYMDDEGKPSDSHYVYIETKGTNGYTGYGWPGDEDEDAWTDDDYRARQTANNAFSMISDMSSHFLEHGYAEKGTTTICGRTCKVYEGTYNRGSSILAVYEELGRDGKHGSFATWNGFALRAKCDKWGYDEETDQRIVTGEYTTFECIAIQIDNIPDAAFTKTVDVTWIR